MYVCVSPSSVGNTHMWQAIQSAADAVLSNDLRLANAILEVQPPHLYIHTNIHTLFMYACIHTFIIIYHVDRRAISQHRMDYWR
jgi:hypothetical protein